MQNSINSFYPISPSPWPLWASAAATFIATVIVVSLTNNTLSVTSIATILVPPTTVAFLWWRDISREALIQGNHHNTIINTLNLSIIAFIISEVIFFFSFFWAFFSSSLTPTLETGLEWPPVHVPTLELASIPALNTTILLSSGASVTWSHHSLMSNNYNESALTILITVLLGVYFTIIQGIEYSISPFTATDSVYGSTFFITTGFHGIHVIIGSTFLTYVLIRILSSHLTSGHHISIELSTWYWHFVDVVWLFLLSSIYWWGS